MKKSYVKPIMESEAFVANEYVGACRFITCDDDEKHGSFVYRGVPTDRKNFIEKNGFADDGFDMIISTWYYSGLINNQEGNRVINFFGEGVNAHKVIVEDTYEKFGGQSFEFDGVKYGPNAS